MPTHVRNAVAAKVEAALKTIGTVSGGPWFLQATPSVKRFSGDILRQEEFPAVWIITAGEALTDGPDHGSTQGVYSSVLRIEVHAWTLAYDTDVAVSGLLHDVMKALGKDRTFSGTCVNSRITGNETLISEDDQPLGGFVLSLEALYRHKADDPAVKIP